MPVYLVHGFRWPRNGITGIRVHAIVHNLEDCSVEYVQNEASKLSILQSFRQAYPDLMQHLDDARTGRTLDFIEQYDPDDESSAYVVSQPHAFVADRVIIMAAGTPSLSGLSRKEVVDLTDTVSTQGPTASLPVGQGAKKPSTASSAANTSSPTHNAEALYLNVEEAMSNGPLLSSQAWEAFAELRDKIAEGEKIGWWVVYNGDPERPFSDYDEEEDEEARSENSVSNTEDEEAKIERDDQHPKAATRGVFPTQGSLLDQPLPTLLPPAMKHLIISEDGKDILAPASDSIATAIPHPPNVARTEHTKPSTETASPSRPKSSRSNFSFPLRRKSSKANVQPPKEDDVPEPPALKEMNKKEGRRYRFFGNKPDKKAG